MRGAVEVGHQLINMDLITSMIKDDEPDEHTILITYVGGGSHWLYFETAEQRDKFYNDFKDANPE